MKQTNPYNVLGFFPLDPPQSYAHILCPIAQLIPFQIKLTGTGFTAYWDLVNYQTGAVTDLNDSLLVQYSDTLNTWIQYDTGTNLDIAEGEYQIRLTINNVTYLSHVLYLCNDFSDCQLSAAAVCAGMKFTFTITDKWEVHEVGVTRTVEVDLGDGNGWQEIGAGSGMLDHGDMQYNVSGQSETLVRVTTGKYGDTCTRLYKLIAQDTDTCTDFQFFPYLDEINEERAHCLTFSNTTDLFQGALLYQFDYEQKFYFRSHIGFPAPVVEDTYQANGQNELNLIEVDTAEQVEKEFYPIPDYLAQVLSNVKPHSSIIIKDLDEGISEAISTFDFAPAKVDSDVAFTGTITYERDRVYQGLDDDVEDVVLVS